MTTKPYKRHKALQPLSRDHHHGLLLSWKIKSGFSKNISVERIKAYADWFYENHLIPHFEIEEAEIFAILGTNNELVKQAIDDHKRLKHLFTEEINTKKALYDIEEELEQHIRFEERILFPEIQKNATEAQLRHIENIHHPASFEENTTDVFWK